MKVLILGLGHVGQALAVKLRGNGHTVVGTTTTPAKVEALANFADEVRIVTGEDRAAVAAAAKDCDSIIVTVAPNVQKTRTQDEREQHYRGVLLESCSSVAATAVPAIFLSSFSVYGDGGKANPVSEITPVANQSEPSARYYHLAEQEILDAGGCALRFPDMYGAPGDLSFPERVKMAHEYFSGKTVFSAHALLYAIHFEDVVSAVVHALDQQLSGIYNVCDERNIPANNKQVFDAICQQEGLQPLEYLNQIKAPVAKISAEKFYTTGYEVAHSTPFPAGDFNA